MFATTSTGEVIQNYQDTTARLKAYRDAIQSLIFAPFNLTTKNSVIEYRSELPKTTKAHFRRQFISNNKSNTGYSTRFSRYPLPTNSMKVSRNTCDPLARATSNTEAPMVLRSRPWTAVSQLASPLYLLGTATDTLQNVSLSHVRTKTRVFSEKFLKFNAELATSLRRANSTRENSW